MTSATSLTDAVKAAAAQGASLTEAVKEAARNGTDGTVINFPRSAGDSRRDTAVPAIRPESVDAPSPEAPLHPPLEAASRPAPQFRYAVEGAVQAPLPGGGRTPRLRLRAGKPGWPARCRTLARRARSSVAAMLRTMTASVRLAILRLGALIVLACLSLVAISSPVGSGSDGPLPVAAQRRVALVIGNSAYLYTRKLDNPRNDATDIGAALRRLGFEVVEGFDLDKAALDAKIRQFTAFLRGADVGVFFYAGHGLHVSGQNYLVPIDAQLTGASALDLELVRLDLVHRTMEREAQTNILFFDACRDSPLSDNLARAMGTRSTEIGRGLGVVHGSAGTLISFSTQPGTLALDGKGRNSPYSAALARQLATSHEDLSTMLIAIRNDVMKATDRKQVPWEHSALTGRFYFNPAPGTSTARPPTPSSPAREAFEAWSLAKDTTSLAVLEAYVSRYGDTFYAELARARMAELNKQGIAAAAPSPIAELAPSFDR